MKHDFESEYKKIEQVKEYAKNATTILKSIESDDAFSFEWSIQDCYIHFWLYSNSEFERLQKWMKERYNDFRVMGVYWENERSCYSTSLANVSCTVMPEDEKIKRGRRAKE